MMPAELFVLTPGEVARWLAPRWRGIVKAAYYDEGVRRRRTLPSMVEDLFPRKKLEVLGGEEMHQRLKSIALESQKRAAARDAPTSVVRK